MVPGRRAVPVAAFAAAGVALVALVALGVLQPTDEDEVQADAARDGPAAAPASDPVASSPFATEADLSGDDADAPVPIPSETGGAADGAEAGTVAAAGATAVGDDPLDPRELGRAPLTDAEHAALLERLSRDPALLAALIDEFRSETDLRRLRRLAGVLDDVNDPAVGLLAAELVYSADDARRQVGLELLGQLPSGDGQARDIASGLLASETNGDVLVGALNVLSRPGNVDDDTRASLAGQVALLVEHEDPSVRRRSVDTLSRWTRDPAHEPLIVDALDDDDAGVREAAVYALVDRPAAGESVREELLTLIENGGEDEGVRRGAVLALNRMTLDEAGQSRVRAVERELARRR